MTSKISFFKLLKEDLKRRSWLIAILALVFFLALPVSLLIQLDRLVAQVSAGSIKQLAVHDFYTGFMGAGAGVFSLLVIVIAVLCGITGFVYLHSKVKVDFYCSLPMRRKKLFFVQYFSGIAIFVIPYVVCIILCLMIGIGNGLVNTAVLAVTFYMFLFRLLSFLVIYALSILAVLLTGKVIVALLGVGVFLVYGSLLVGIYIGLSETFWVTKMLTESSTVLLSYLSPILLSISVEAILGYGEQAGDLLNVWLGIGALVLWAILTTGLCLWLHVARRAEAAEGSMAFRKTEGPIKALLVVPLSLGIALYFSEMMSGNNHVWFFVGLLFGVVVLSAVIEFIYHLDLREIFAHKRQLALTAVSAIIITCIFLFDWAGYNTYLPDKDEVAQMSVYYAPLSESYSYNKYYNDNISSNYNFYGNIKGKLNDTMVSDIDAIYEIARSGVMNVKNGNHDADAGSVCIAYKLKSGKEVYRTYWLDFEQLQSGMSGLLKNEEYKIKLFPLLQEPKDVIPTFILSSIDGEVELDLTREERIQLLETYEKELLDITVEASSDQTMVQLIVNYRYNNVNSSEGWYPIYESFEETIKLLKQFSDTEILEEELQAGDIERIEIYGEQFISFTKEAEIEEILKDLKFTSMEWNYLHDMDNMEEMSISVILKNGFDLRLQPYFEKGKVPALVQTALGQNGVDK